MCVQSAREVKGKLLRGASATLGGMSMPAIILAAGASRRLGQPKQLVRIQGERLLGRTIRVAKESGVDPVFVVIGAQQEVMGPEVERAGVVAVMNPAWEQGIASSVRAGLGALAEALPEAKGVLLLVCDQPKLTAEHLRALEAAFDAAAGAAIVASGYDGIAGIPVIFPAGQFGSLLGLQGDTGARSLLRNPPVPLLTVDFALGAIDIDTPEDLASQGL